MRVLVIDLDAPDNRHHLDKHGRKLTMAFGRVCCAVCGCELELEHQEVVEVDKLPELVRKAGA